MTRFGIFFLVFLCLLCLPESESIPRGGRGGGNGGGRSGGGKGGGKQGVRYGGYLLGGAMTGYAAHKAVNTSQGGGLNAWAIVAIIVGIAMLLAMIYHVLEYFCVNTEESCPPSSMNSSGNTLLIEDKEDIEKSKSPQKGHYQDNVKGMMANGGLTLPRTDSFMKKGDTEVFL